MPITCHPWNVRYKRMFAYASGPLARKPVTKEDKLKYELKLELLDCRRVRHGIPGCRVAHVGPGFEYLDGAREREAMTEMLVVERLRSKGGKEEDCYIM